MDMPLMWRGDGIGKVLSLPNSWSVLLHPDGAGARLSVRSPDGTVIASRIHETSEDAVRSMPGLIRDLRSSAGVRPGEPVGVAGADARRAQVHGFLSTLEFASSIYGAHHWRVVAIDETLGEFRISADGYVRFRRRGGAVEAPASSCDIEALRACALKGSLTVVARQLAYPPGMKPEVRLLHAASGAYRPFLVDVVALLDDGMVQSAPVITSQPQRPTCQDERVLEFIENWQRATLEYREEGGAVLGSAATLGTSRWNGAAQLEVNRGTGFVSASPEEYEALYAAITAGEISVEVVYQGDRYSLHRANPRLGYSDFEYQNTALSSLEEDRSLTL